MQVVEWPIDRPIPYARNARNIPQAAIDKVAASIKEFGWQQPVVVDEAGVIICGHTRLLAARKLGLEVVPVHIASNLSTAQVKAYRLLDNRSHEEATWDMELLGAELVDLQASDLDLLLTGFDQDEIAKLLAEQSVTQGLTDDDAVPDTPEEPVTKPGDVWILGRHRLLCGDSTDLESIGKLLGDSRADLIFSDPPYNCDYTGYTAEKLKIQSDKLSPDAFREFLELAFQACRTAVKAGASAYICHGSSYQREFQNALEAGGFSVRCQIIWAKNTFAWGFGRYKFQHEPIFYCHTAGQSDAWYGDKTQSTLWHEKKPAANRLHPTMKPVELIERALVNSSKAGDLVFDPFGGSGSTLIACEKVGRNAVLIELDPRYVDVIVQRWEAFTGHSAVLEQSGRTFVESGSEAEVAV
ncbi:MAG: DNA modification methylase [Bryobacteraceae bacterium]